MPCVILPKQNSQTLRRLRQKPSRAGSKKPPWLQKSTFGGAKEPPQPFLFDLELTVWGVKLRGCIRFRKGLIGFRFWGFTDLFFVVVV